MFYRPGTLFVILDVDREILEWLSLLSSKQLADCSWLVALPVNSDSISMTTSVTSINETEISATNNLLSPFRPMTSKNSP